VIESKSGLTTIEFSGSKSPDIVLTQTQSNPERVKDCWLSFMIRKKLVA
jgi:hypothetical protein